MTILSHKLFERQNLAECSETFITNDPFPHIVIDNFLSEESANKALSSFELNENWINCSLVNNYKKYQLTKKNFMNETCNQIFDELASKPMNSSPLPEDISIQSPTFLLEADRDRSF